MAKGKTEAQTVTNKDIVIEQPRMFSLAMEIEGTASLIQNHFAQKSLDQILAKHTGHTVQRETKKPREVLEGATTRNTDGRVCIPPMGIKKAMLSAAAEMKGQKKTMLRRQFYVDGNSVPITFETMVPRMDIVRLQGIGRPPDVRFRPEFQGWKARVLLSFMDSISPQTVVDLLNRAGRGGVCEWRPERDGTFGTFRVSRHITSKEEIGDIQAECAVPLVALRIPDWAMDVEINPNTLRKIVGSEDSHAEAEETIEEVKAHG